MNFIKIFFLFFYILIISGCSSLIQNNLIGQGIKISNQQIKNIKIGMNKKQVEYILGTPNLVDIYYPNFWYYIFYIISNRKMVGEKILIKFDKTNKVILIQKKII